jgi:hypothetical protein
MSSRSDHRGHWPSGKRRNPIPADWPRIRGALDQAAQRRQMRLVARKIGVHVDTVYRWRVGDLLPEPDRIAGLIDALYALKLYYVRPARSRS